MLNKNNHRQHRINEQLKIRKGRELNGEMVIFQKNDKNCNAVTGS